MKKIAIFTLAMAMLAGCKKETNDLRSGNTQDGLVSIANAGSAKNSRPINIDFYSTVDPASPTLNCTLPGVPFAIANSGYFLHGNATHLGLIDAETSMGIDGSCHLDGFTLILSTTTSGQIVAANGDKITYTGADEIDLNDIVLNGGTTAVITGLWTITGGTGRFANATGSFNIIGIVDVTTAGGPTFSITGEGTITY